jgi:Zn-dependent protease
MNIASTIQLICVIALPLIFAITLHEAAHGWVAHKLGDQTAWMMGRVTLNPAKHIDLLGTIILPVIMLIISGFMFGWAKPVPVNWRALKNPKRDMAFVAIAGPCANLLMALLWALVAKLAQTLLVTTHGDSSLFWIAEYFELAGKYGIFINCILLVLNLIPIPPLDGSRVVSSLLPAQAAYQYEKIEPFGIWILLGLLLLGFLGHILQAPTYWLMQHIVQAFGLS